MESRYSQNYNGNNITTIYGVPSVANTIVRNYYSS